MKYEPNGPDKENDGEEWKKNLPDTRARVRKAIIQRDLERSNREAFQFQKGLFSLKNENTLIFFDKNEEYRRIYQDCPECHTNFVLVGRQIGKGAIQVLMGCPNCDNFKEDNGLCEYDRE